MFIILQIKLILKRGILLFYDKVRWDDKIVQFPIILMAQIPSTCVVVGRHVRGGFRKIK